jgi:nitroreductase / dihydropteridine reductase
VELIETLRWRYATKKYSDRKIAEDILQRVITAISLSASSFGLQPYRLFVIDNETLRKQLSEHSFNPQVAEASHLLLFAAHTSINEEVINDYITLIARERGISTVALEIFKQKGLMPLLDKTEEDFFIWAARQAYIALGTALIAAAAERVDATPMEGFSPNMFDELLGLKEKGLKSVVLLSLGYRDEHLDHSAKLKKVRWPREQFVTHLT